MMEGLRIVFCFSNREVAADCYTLEDVDAFLSDVATDFTEEGQLKLRWYVSGVDSVPFTWFTEVCKCNAVPSTELSSSGSLYCEDEDV